MATPLSEFQLNMQVCDDNVPQKCDAATAYIRVIREQFPPVFIDTPYNVDISEFQQVRRFK